MGKICIYSYDMSDYTTNGLAVLDPISCVVTEEAGGSYELSLVHPLDYGGKWKHIKPNYIIKASVPAVHAESIIAGDTVDIWKVTSVYGSDVYSRPQAAEPITYETWTGGIYYPAGKKVTFSSQNYQLMSELTGFEIYSSPDTLRSKWSEISNTTVGSPVLAKLNTGDEVFMTEDYNTTWIRCQTYTGIEGYMKKIYAVYDRTEQAPEIEDRAVSEQLFRIYNVQVDAAGMQVNASARHVSYDLSMNCTKVLKLSNVSPSTAIALMRASLVNDPVCTIATSLTEDDGLYTNDLSWKNGTYFLLDPDNGFLNKYRARLVRDNWDMFVYKNNPVNRGFRIQYGKNLVGLNWKRNVEQLVTRVIPRAQKSNGDPLLLDNVFVDSELIDSYPLVYTQILSVNGKVGGQNPDGGTWTEETLKEYMNQQAQNRFDVDHADAISVEVTVDFVMLGDTEEYAQYKGLQKCGLYDLVRVVDSELGLDVSLQVSKVKWNSCTDRYEGITLGNIFDYGGRYVAPYTIGNGTIEYDKLSQQAIDRIKS